MTHFWNSWTMCWCGTLGLFGIILAGGALPATDGLAQLYFHLMNHPEEIDFTPHLRVSLAVLGGVCVGWSMTLFATFQAANALSGTAAIPTWRLLSAGLVSWYVLDSVLSIATGFWLNAVVNTIFFVALLSPIVSAGVLRDRTQH